MGHSIKFSAHTYLQTTVWKFRFTSLDCPQPNSGNTFYSSTTVNLSAYSCSLDLPFLEREINVNMFESAARE